jgi:tetrahydromethanopterin S-methyltransferase subunit F
LLVRLDQNIEQISLATVILGCLASVLLILVMLIVLSDRTRGKEKMFIVLSRKTSFSSTMVFMHDCHSGHIDPGEFPHAWTDSLYCILFGLHLIGIVKSGERLFEVVCHVQRRYSSLFISRYHRLASGIVMHGSLYSLGHGASVW